MIFYMTFLAKFQKNFFFKLHFSLLHILTFFFPDIYQPNICGLFSTTFISTIFFLSF